MKYLLDSNIVIRYINGRSANIIQQMRHIPDTDIAISSVTKGEMYAGAARSQTPERSRAKQEIFFVRFQSLPYDDAAAHVFGQLRAKLEDMGTPIGPYDMQIAAIAIVYDLIVVTHNTREFGRIDGLNWVDWEISG